MSPSTLSPEAKKVLATKNLAFSALRRYEERHHIPRQNPAEVEPQDEQHARLLLAFLDADDEYRTLLEPE